MTWDDLLDYYIGQVGIKPGDFWAQTWKENQLLGESYNIKQNLEWERLRYLSAMIFNVNCQKRSQMIKPSQLFPLPQDHYVNIEKSKPKSTKEQFEAFKQRAEKANFNEKVNAATFGKK